MKDNFEGFGISSKDDEFGNTSVECFSGLIGSLLDKFEILSLVKNI